MNFFLRKYSCIFIEEQLLLEETKNLFCRKLDFLQKQLKLCFESIHKNKEIAPEFILGALISLDLNSKVLSALKHLATSSESKWSFLRKNATDNHGSCVFGTVDKKSLVINTVSLCRDVEWFFFRLCKLGSIDVENLFNIFSLSYASGLIGINRITDWSYYESKDEELIKMPSSWSSFEEGFQENKNKLFEFLGSSIKFKDSPIIFWNFISTTEKLKNYREVLEFFSSSRYKYELMRGTKKFIKMPPNQFEFLIKAIGEIDGFEKLNTVLAEFDLSNNPQTRNLFGAVFLFFLNQNSFIFDVENPINKKYTDGEKFLNAANWLDLILYLSENELNFLKNAPEEVVNRFKSACDLQLSIFKDSHLVNSFCVFNPSYFLILDRIVKSIKKNVFYKRYFSKIIDPFLENINVSC